MMTGESTPHWSQMPLCRRFAASSCRLLDTVRFRDVLPAQDRGKFVPWGGPSGPPLIRYARQYGSRPVKAMRWSWGEASAGIGTTGA
jgi:hypothetical protein